MLTFFKNFIYLGVPVFEKKSNKITDDVFMNKREMCGQVDIVKFLPLENIDK